MENKQIEMAVTEILKAVGDDPMRDGLLETPQRVAKMYGEVLSSQGVEKFEDYKVFYAETTNNSQMVLIHDIPFYSMCEHHMLPFFGVAHVAYIPDNNQIIGLSKIPRLVDFASKKLSVQENITRDVAMILDEILSPKGVAVVLEARHMCVEMRGVRKGEAKTRTSYYSGKFDTDASLRSEFLQEIRG